MFRIYLVLFIVLAVSLQISAQCSGVYFKESSRQMFSNPFAYSYFEDFDNDGLNDVFGFSPTGPNSYQIHFYKRLSSNTFDTVSKTSSITNVNDVFGIFGDVNNDGKKDLIVSHTTNPPVLTTYLNDGTGRFVTTTPAIEVNSNETFWIAGDLNNDGKADVLSTTPNANNTSTLNYRLARADNSFGPAVAITTFSSFLAGYEFIERSNASLIIDDLNNDGLKDIAFVTYQSSTLKVLTNTGNAAFTETLSTSFTQSVNRLRAVDLNNDGKKDFVSRIFQDTANPNIYKVKIVANTGNNTFVNSEIVVPAYYNYNDYYVNGYSVGDFDGDGDTDIIFAGAKKYLLLKNQGNFTFTQQEFRSYLNINSADNVDGDGKSDIISLEHPFLDGNLQLTYPNALYYLSNAVIFRQNVCNPIGQTKTVDFDGDGSTDLAFWNPSTGIWRYYTENSQDNQVSFKWGSGALGDLPVPNDYDGDGKTDYAVFRKSDGNWWIFKSSDQQVLTFKFGISTDKPIPADYDGDGKADIAVYRPSEGNWYIWLSQSNQSQVIRFGLAEDKLLPADYDGDGKADISVYRPSTGTWYRLNSSNNSFFAVQYGISTDKPVPTDYDGDGKANIAVFRDGSWYVLRDNFSTSIFYWGTANDTAFFGNDVMPTAFVYRRTNSSIYSTRNPVSFSGLTSTYSTGNSFDEILVSSILPPE